MRGRAAVLAAATALVAAPVASAARVAEPLVRAPGGVERGTVVLLHGGAWSTSGRAVMRTVAGPARRFRREGWRTVNADYGSGAGGLRDVLRVVDAQLARGGPVCLYGESAGGHWALLAATRRPGVDCVIALAAPTELERVPDGSTLGILATATFGDRRAALSPARSASTIRARVLLGYGLTDTVVPLPQGLQMRLLTPRASLVVLPRGDREWLHTTTTADAVAALGDAELTLLRGIS